MIIHLARGDVVLVTRRESARHCKVVVKEDGDLDFIFLSDSELKKFVEEEEEKNK